MIIFNNIRTKRLAVRLREITIDEAVSVCRLPAERHEATTTEFLRCVARDAESPTPRYVTDPRMMTVEERTLLVCHYLAQVSGSGPNFPVGESGCLLDYVAFADDLAVDHVDMGEVAGKARTLRPLLGAHVETLERLCESRGDWLIGVLACQVHDAGAPVPEYTAMTDVELLEWCQSRIKAIRGMGESEVEELYVHFDRCKVALKHFFIPGANDGGMVYLPQPEAEEAGRSTPARFRALPCISEFTRRLFA